MLHILRSMLNMAKKHDPEKNIHAISAYGILVNSCGKSWET